MAESRVKFLPVRGFGETTRRDSWWVASAATFAWAMVWESAGTPHQEAGHDVFVCRRAGEPEAWRAVWRTVVGAA